MPTRDANFNFMIVTDYLYFNSLADVSSFVLDVASVWQLVMMPKLVHDLQCVNTTSSL